MPARSGRLAHRPRAACRRSSTRPHGRSCCATRTTPPAGCSTPRNSAAIAEVAEKHDLLIISDEIWGDLTHPGATHIPIASLGERHRGADRDHLGGEQGVQHRRTPLRSRAHRARGSGRRTRRAAAACSSARVGSPGAEATLAAWTAGDPWLGTCARTSPRSATTSPLGSAEELPSVGLRRCPQATYLAWLDFRALGLGDDPAKELLERGRVALSSGLDFGEAGAGFARLNFATSRELLDEIVDRIVTSGGRVVGNQL